MEKLMKKAIVFDLYGTLLDIHTDEQQDLLWDKMAYLYSLQGAHYAADELREAYGKHVAVLLEKQQLKGVDFPDIDLLKVFKNLYKVKHVKASKSILVETAKFFRVLSLDYIKPYPGTIELLEYLKASPFKVILLSNAQESFTMDELKADLAALDDGEKYGAVLRAKGIVKGEGCWIHFDYVPGESNIRTGSASVMGRLCVIGSKLNEHELSELFGV